MDKKIKGLEPKVYQSRYRKRIKRNSFYCQTCGKEVHKRDMFLVCIKCLKKLKENVNML